MSATIGLVDYGMGNRRSMQKSLERAGATVVLTGDHDALRATDGIVVPGVGAFAAAMRLLEATGLDALIRERAAAGVPVLGACLGMQLLFEHGAEHGGADGLGLLPGEVVPLAPRGLKLPHIGWNQVRWVRPSPLSQGLADPTPFYHVHSFVPAPSDDDVAIGMSDYGVEFASVVGRGNVFGTQFHPEKSSRDGIALLANFIGVCAPVEAAAA
ncbi:imidazole glycerol phosphate synthase subunit HisH [Baekduia soli]|uniref:Imidazole glycerol phosphate synthase subunit HisH n=1 Tax=Baekduia soli TaxID=496014 RepID=A0A5B8U7S1_9ACTN|nr:imidazole glycerol phosphate synthase subunit HisH [Baekduia soli]QEC49156.1 imidazole glycerol phosphate synthase subunit HisH [Baekduia soli]